MESILLIAHTDENGALSKVACEALALSLQLRVDLKGSLAIGIVGKGAKACAEKLGRCDAQNYYAVEGSEFESSRYASDVAAYAEFCKACAATLVIAPAGSRIQRSLPGVAQRLNGRIDSHVSAVNTQADGTLAVQRWYYRQRLLGTLARTKRPWFLIVESGAAAAFSDFGASAKVQALTPTLSADDLGSSVKGTRAASAGTTTIRPEADVLFVAGAGWMKKQSDGKPHVKEAEELILGFLNTAKASLGSSKSLVDVSGEGAEVLPFMSHLNQVGQTGSTPRHPKGLATCCHGEEPHVVGWRFINERRAVNLDPNCGWAMNKADVLYVADAFAVIREVNRLLGS